MSTVSFRHSDLIKKAKEMPPSYLHDVLRSSWRRGPEVVMSMDAYLSMREKYAVIAPASVDLSKVMSGKLKSKPL